MKRYCMFAEKSVGKNVGGVRRFQNDDNENSEF